VVDFLVVPTAVSAKNQHSRSTLSLIFSFELIFVFLIVRNLLNTDISVLVNYKPGLCQGNVLRFFLTPISGENIVSNMSKDMNRITEIVQNNKFAERKT